MRHTDYSMAESTLATALLASIGEINVVLLKTTFPAIKSYALTPRQIVDTMIAKHGIPTSDDITKLREPLSRALTSLSDLESHMGNFLLASQRLTRSGQGETPYHYFELFLVTVSGFPSVAHSMTTYYAQYPAVLQQDLATLFPFLEKMRDHLAKTDPASPFSGAARGPPHQPKTRKFKGHTRKGQQQQPQQQHDQRSQRWGPNGPVILAAHTSGPDPRDAKIDELTALLAGMTAAPGYGGHVGMPVPPQASLQANVSSSARPRAYYCWLHGWNNSHNGQACKIMTNDPAYTAGMKRATGPHGTGGNPKIGVPVSYLRPKFFYPLPQTLSCPPCTPSPHSTPPLALSCSQACLDRQHTAPHEDTRVHVLQTLPSLSSEGLPADRVRDFACSIFPSPAPEPLNSALPSLAPPVPLNPFRNVSYEPFPVDPSHPSMFASPFCLDSTPTLTPYPTPQHQSPPHPQPNPPPPAKPPSQPPISSRFAHPNRFQALSTTSESIASHISWSVPVVTFEIPPAPHSPSFPAQHSPQHQAHIRHTILQQDKTPCPC